MAPLGFAAYMSEASLKKGSNYIFERLKKQLSAPLSRTEVFIFACPPNRSNYAFFPSPLRPE